MASNSIPAKPKYKKCKVCKHRFQIIRSTQAVCCYQCAIELARINADKKEKKQHREAKKKLKDNDRSFQLKKTQTIFNKFIRIRDEKEPCISCGRHHKGQYHAGHYKSVGSSPELRFEPLNNNKQCSACNNYLSGNLSLYRVNLIAKIGIDKVEWLEGPHEPKRYTIPELKELQVKFKLLTEALES